MPPDKKDIDAFIDSLTIDWDVLIDQVTPLLMADGEAAAENQLILLGLIEPRDSKMWRTILPQVQQASRARAAELIGKRVLPDGTIVNNPNPAWSITDTTRDRLKTLLNTAIDEGWTANKAQHEIIESEAFSPARALTIARTESGMARGRGSHIAAKSAGMSTKEWLLGADPCDECKENAEIGRIPIDEPFPSGDDCPIAHPNCRCSCAYYQAEEE